MFVPLLKSMSVNLKKADEIESAVPFNCEDWDLCVVFPVVNDNLGVKAQQYVERFHELGFEYYIYRGYKRAQIFCLLRLSLDSMRKLADKINLPMMLDPNVAALRLATGNPSKNIQGVTIPHDPKYSRLKPFEFIYGKYSMKVEEDLYLRGALDTTPFNELVRVKLSSRLLESKKSSGGSNLKIERYIRNGDILACYSLHNNKLKEELTKKWSFQATYFLPWNQPLTAVKNYFGEKIGLYFAFLNHYTLWLTIPALVGLPMQLATVAMNDYNAPYLPFYSVFIVGWAIFMLEFWKRKESNISMEWGTLDYQEFESDRPDFRGEEIKSYIDGSPMVYYPHKKREKYIRQSLLATILLVCCVGGIVTSIYVIRFTLSPIIGSDAQTLASILNALQIQVSNMIYSFLAVELTKRENHQTDSQHEASLVAKTFMFQFVNSYASFFYLAFFAHFFHECPPDSDGGCMYPLTVNLAIIFGSRLVTNIIGLLIPFLTSYYTVISETKALKGDLTMLTQPELEFLKQPYDASANSISDYAELAVQFGYSTLFVTALPIASLLSLVSNIIEARLHAYKLLSLYHRPRPYSARDIGIWQTVFLLISVFSVITNASIMCFTMDSLFFLSLQTRFWIFVGFQWVCFVSQTTLMELIPDMTEKVSIQHQRSKFIASKLIDFVEDDEDKVLDQTLAGVTVTTGEHPSGRYFN